MAGPLIPVPRRAGPWQGGYQGYRGAAPLAPTTQAQADAESAVGTPQVSSVTTTTSPSTSTTRPIISKNELAAAEKVEQAQQAGRAATVAKMEAEVELENRALAAEGRRLEQEAAAAERAAQLEANMIAENERAQAAADKAQADADAKVKMAQDQAINWDDRGAGVKILHALIRGASAKNALIMGTDPNNGVVARVLNESLAAEKEKKFQRLSAEKENAAALKSKNKEDIERLNNKLRAQATLEANANARNLIMSEKTDALAAKLAAKDPNGAAFKANKDLALSLLDASDAVANRAYAASTRASVTTQSGQSQTVSTEGPQADKRPVATREEIKDIESAKSDVETLDRLKAAVLKDPEAFKHVTETLNNFAGDQDAKALAGKFQGVGPAAIGLAGMIQKRYRVTKADQLLDVSKHKNAGQIYSDVQEALGIKARSEGGVPTKDDRELAGAVAALGITTPEQFAKWIEGEKKKRQAVLDGLSSLPKQGLAP